MIAHQTHEFGPLLRKDSKILILGSFPSVASRQAQFFYGHPQNRFWAVLAGCFNEPKPLSVEEKKEFCFCHQIALYDAIEECDIVGSSDASIRNPVPTDIMAILKGTCIEKIICNGKTSYRYFCKYQPNEIVSLGVCLPSTSPANAAFSLERLILCWQKEIVFKSK